MGDGVSTKDETKRQKAADPSRPTISEAGYGTDDPYMENHAKGYSMAFKFLGKDEEKEKAKEKEKQEHDEKTLSEHPGKEKEKEEQTVSSGVEEARAELEQAEKEKTKDQEKKQELTEEIRRHWGMDPKGYVSPVNYHWEMSARLVMKCTTGPDGQQYVCPVFSETNHLLAGHPTLGKDWVPISSLNNVSKYVVEYESPGLKTKGVTGKFFEAKSAKNKPQKPESSTD